MCLDRLPTKEHIQRYNSEIDVRSSLCSWDTKTIEHLFFNCPYARVVLCNFLDVVGLNVAVFSLTKWIRVFAKARNKKSKLLQLRATAISCSIYIVSECRYKVLFAKERIPLEACIFRIKQMLAGLWVSRGIGSGRSIVDIGIKLELVEVRGYAPKILYKFFH